MKKRGFTLAEVLIAVGVVGILAAVTLPMVNKFKPDTTKITYLRTYDAIAETVALLTKNEDLYPSFTADTDYTEYPLANTTGGETTYAGSPVSRNNNRFCEALAIGFNRNGAPKCKNSSADYGDDAAFTTTNGIAIRVMPNFPNDTTYLERYMHEIVIDIDGFNSGNNCMNVYANDINNCPNPDRFSIYVSSDGTLIPADRSGIVYLESRTNTRYQEYQAPENDTIYSYLKISKPGSSSTSNSYYLGTFTDPMWQFQNWLKYSESAKMTSEKALQSAIEKSTAYLEESRERNVETYN